ncbi:MAG: hypothetical protein Q9195_008473 [Heterodermia aff. obscurata]
MAPTPQSNALDHEVGTSKPAEACYSTFSKKSKRGIVLLVALAGFFSPLSANIYFPALDYIASDLHVSLELMNLTITAYLICQGTIALAISVVADIAPPHQRGQYVGAALSGPNTAPSIGPVLGGVLAERANWRWIFWFLAILSGICLLLILLLLPETARNIVGNGSVFPCGIHRAQISILQSKEQHKAHKAERRDTALRLPNPLSCLRIICHKNTSFVLVSNAIFYMNYSCMQASLAPLLMRIYGLNALQVGLTYLPYGVGCGLASYAAGKIIDRDYKKTATSMGITIDRVRGDDIGKFPIERARLRSIWYFIAISTACTIGYGWTLQSTTHVAVPLILQFLCGLTVTGTFNVSLKVLTRNLQDISEYTILEPRIKC